MANCRLERLGPELVTHLGEFDPGLRRQHSMRAEALPRIALHADKVVVSRRFEKNVLGFAAGAVAMMLAAGQGLQVTHGEGHPDRELARAGAQRLDAEAMRL